MRIRNRLFTTLLIAFISTGLTSFKNINCVQEGIILKFNSLKCGGCWGWTIKVGNDTIKTDHLPFNSNITQQLEYPQKIKIGLGEKQLNQNSIDYEYYKVNCIELITEPNCTNIIWYQFIGGMPDMHYVEISKSVAKKWGFTIHYEFGSCGNNEDDKRMAKECTMKNKEALPCLTEKYGEDWQNKFYEQVDQVK